MQNFGRKAMANNSIRQFTNRAGTLIAKNPFWALVIGSLGVHLIFVLIPFTPAKKAVEPPPLIEVKTATLPVVKLPPQSNRNLNRDLTNRLPRSTSNISNVSKSIFDSLFVQSSTNKLIPPSNVPPNSFPNSFPNSVPSPFELNSIERMDGFPPLMELPDVPLPSTNFEIDPSREFVKPRTSTPLPLQQSRTNALGQIDNSNPVKTTSNSNLRPEFQNNNGLRDNSIIPSNEPKNIKNNEASPKPPQSPISQNQPINPPPSQSSIPPDVRQKNETVLDLMTSDPEVSGLDKTGMLDYSRIVPNPKDVVSSQLLRETIEPVPWIRPEGNITAKRGTVIANWILYPNGKIKKYWISMEGGDNDLLEIVAQAAKGYVFKPNEKNPDSYRLVRARYEFPAK